MIHDDMNTIDALMAYYVAGSLPQPVHVLMESHLWMKKDHRDVVAGLESLAGDELDRMPATSLTNRQKALQSIFSSPAPKPALTRKRASLVPPPIQRMIGYDETDIPWRAKLPGFKEYQIELDGLDVRMMWIRPGRKMPAHTHKGVELTLVLDGAYSDGHGRFGPGDISVADGDLDHQPVAESERPCIAYSVLDAPLKLTGSFRQIIGDLIG
ncbi:ChrR family anti-sigma-E factor [Oryzifoliimicrobium ureilyticus]|uniref:ChrR family anti-sigma-E factor n=1 Tax=Oryzifoliimicrobium ureilyticus TaxID=3113724 RepID=UPI0030764CAF